jgi:hypothetical protein
MAFTINPEIPPQVWGVGEQVTIQIGMADGSTPSPTAFSATGLPIGLSISNAGKITGSTDDPGLYDCTITATGSGPVTDTITLQIGIANRIGDLSVPGGAIEVDFDIRTGRVSVPGTTPGSNGAIIHAKSGDTPQFAVGFLKDSVLQELDMVTLSTAVKRYDTEEVLNESDGVFFRVGAGDGTRYLIDVTLDGVEASLSDEEDEKGTFADYLVEIQASWNFWPPGTDPEDPGATSRTIVRTSQTFLVRVERDWIDEP